MVQQEAEALETKVNLVAVMAA